jgi:hypothetical protein
MQVSHYSYAIIAMSILCIDLFLSNIKERPFLEASNFVPDFGPVEIVPGSTRIFQLAYN